MKSTNKPVVVEGWVKIAVTIIAVVLVTTAISAIQLSMLRDGTQNYTGVKLAAAQHALTHVKNIYQSEPYGGWSWSWNIGSKLQVISVEHGSEPCEKSMTPNDIGYYDVVVRQNWLFGISSENTWDGCILQMDAP